MMGESQIRALPAVHAAEELLARAGWDRHWRKGPTEPTSIPIDFLAAERDAVRFDLSEESVIRIAISMATGNPVDLRSAFGHLTRDHAALVMTAIACASGHDGEEYRVTTIDDVRRVETVPPLGKWGPSSRDIDTAAPRSRGDLRADGSNRPGGDARERREG